MKFEQENTCKFIRCPLSSDHYCHYALFDFCRLHFTAFLNVCSNTPYYNTSPEPLQTNPRDTSTLTKHSTCQYRVYDILKGITSSRASHHHHHDPVVALLAKRPGGCLYSSVFREVASGAATEKAQP
jgi:hypothetical protein